MKIGEGFAGEGPNAAHVNVVLGHRDGHVGTAWATALATPSAGHVPFVVVARPGVPVVPFTLFVNKAAIAHERHGTLTWGAAQAGLARGVADAHDAGVFKGEEVSELVLIAAVWVDPAANDEEAVHENNRLAAAEALKMAHAGGPRTTDALAAMRDPSNPFFRRA